MPTRGGKLDAMRFGQAIWLWLCGAALVGCTQIDDFVGDTIVNVTGKPTATARGSPVAAAAPGQTAERIVLKPPSAAAPAKPSVPIPPGKVVWIGDRDSRLILDLPTLAGGTADFRFFRGKAGRYTEEDAQWHGPGYSPHIAGILLSESVSGPPISDAQDPMVVLGHWPVFQNKRAAFGELIGTQNVLGPVLWRRCRVVTRTCVVFLQRWGGETGASPVTTLTGYYCASPGETLAPGAAETVVRSIGIRQAPG
ncbi:MAG: hypothetical protein QF827_00035 [Alphaproteobacteria bacterium]|nr:hypothetical protein [Alphaproteobacteria bacterium]